MTSITFTLALKVDEESQFRQRAYEQALAEHLEDDEAKTYLDSDETSLTQCAIMIFDPGVSPLGCSIQESSAEVDEDHLVLARQLQALELYGFGHAHRS